MVTPMSCLRGSGHGGSLGRHRIGWFLRRPAQLHQRSLSVCSMSWMASSHWCPVAIYGSSLACACGFSHFFCWLAGHRSFPKHDVVHDPGVDSAAIEGCGKPRIVSQLARIGVP